MTFDSSEHDREIRELKNRYSKFSWSTPNSHHTHVYYQRLAQEEKSHRSEITHLKMRSDNKNALLQEETQATQMQLEKARRERDTFR